MQPTQAQAQDGATVCRHRESQPRPPSRATLHRLPYFTLHSANTRDLIERRKLDALGPGLLGRPTWRFEDAVDGAVWQMKRGRRSSYSALDWHLDFPHDLPLTLVVTEHGVI